jgi:hypothetical protein
MLQRCPSVALWTTLLDAQVDILADITVFCFGPEHCMLMTASASNVASERPEYSCWSSTAGGSLPTDIMLAGHEPHHPPGAPKARVVLIELTQAALRDGEYMWT